MNGINLKKIKQKSELHGYLFIAPFFVVFAVFQLYPMFYSMYLSFTDLQGFMLEPTAFNFDNYIYLWNLPRFWQTYINTAKIWLVNFAPQLIFSLMFAAIFTSVRLRMRGAGTFKVIYFMPNIITATSVAVLFGSLMTYQSGPVDQLFKALGLLPTTYNFAREEVGARMVISFIQFWRYFGNSMIIFAAGMLGINPALYEAAEIDGASKPRMFFSITLPLLKPIMLYSLVTSLVGGLQMFEIPYLYLSGGPRLDNGRYGTETIAVYIYKIAFEHGGENDYALASAASVYLFVIAVVLSVALFKLFGSKEDSGNAKRKY